MTLVGGNPRPHTIDGAWMSTVALLDGIRRAERLRATAMVVTADGTNVDDHWSRYTPSPATQPRGGP